MPQENEFEANVANPSEESGEVANPSEEGGQAQAAPSMQEADQNLGEPTDEGDGPNRWGDGPNG